MPDPVVLIAIAFLLLGGLFLAAGLLALRRRRIIGSVLGTLVALLCLALAALCATITLATRGYRALTREEVVAVVEVEPTGERWFRATFRFLDGRRASFDLAGDELYVDAHILKWQPLANVLGLHTAYELDRVAGRYRELRHERERLRTVFSLAEPKLLDLFDLRQRFALLAPLLDAEYGSATFAPADRRAAWELRVSTTGLLARSIAPGDSEVGSRAP